MDEQNDICRILDVIPRHLIRLGYILITCATVICFLFFFYLDIPQTYEAPVRLNYSNNRCEGKFDISQEYFDHIITDTLPIYIQDKVYSGIITHSEFISGAELSVIVTVISVNETPLPKVLSNIDTTLTNARVKIKIKSTFIEKILHKRSVIN